MLEKIRIIGRTNHTKANGSLELNLMKRKTGIITMFNDAKGVGFIQMDEVEKEVIFYIAGLKEDVREKDRVIFDLTNSSRGLTAVNVTKSGKKKTV